MVSILQQLFTIHFHSQTAAMENDDEKSGYYSVLHQLIGIMTSPPNDVVVRFLSQLFFLEPQHPSAALFTTAIQQWMNKTDHVAVNRLLEKVLLFILFLPI